MKFAPIVPYEYVGLISDRDYHLILPQCVRASERYASAYGLASGFKVLDNGAAEGQLANTDELFEVAKIMNVHEIVVPDVLGDLRGTIGAVQAFAEVAKKHPKYSYMAVVQGASMDEIMSCFYFYQAERWITRIAFPRIWGQLHRGLRTSMAESLMAEIHESFPNGVHALGANEFMLEPIMLSSIPGGNPIVGMDTSMPAVAAIEGINIAAWPEAPQRKEGFFETKYDSTTAELMARNIAIYDQWCRNF